MESRDTSPPEQQDDCEQQMPRYDCDERALYVGTEKIKVFRSPAENQERILWAFQEANWAIKIDDPLPGDPNIVPKKRLKDTLRALNQGLDKKDIIRFVGGRYWRRRQVGVGLAT